MNVSGGYCQCHKFIKDHKGTCCFWCLVHGKIDCPWAFGVLRPWQMGKSEGLATDLWGWASIFLRDWPNEKFHFQFCTFSSFAAFPRGDLLPFGEREPFPDDLEALRLDALGRAELTMVNDSNINNMGVSKNRGTPKWMVFMETPI